MQRSASHGGDSGGSHLLGWDRNLGALTRAAKVGEKTTM